MKRTSVRQLVISVSVLGALTILFLFNPIEHSFFPPCLFKKLTGLDCPGCGSTRGLHALLHGHVLEAMDFNLLLIPGLFFIGLSGIYGWNAKALWLWEKLNQPRITLWIVCTFWIMRNLPFYPFRWMNSSF